MTTRSLTEQTTAHRSWLHFDVQGLHISFDLKCLWLVSTAFDQGWKCGIENKPFYTCGLGVLAFE